MHRMAQAILADSLCRPDLLDDASNDFPPRSSGRADLCTPDTHRRKADLCFRRLKQPFNRVEQQGALQTVERRFFIVEKSVVMVYNKLINFAGVMVDYGKAGLIEGGCITCERKN